MLNRKINLPVLLTATCVLAAVFAMTALAFNNCPHTFATTQPSDYKGFNQDCKTKIDFAFDIDHDPPLGGHLDNGDKYCLVSYTLDPEHGSCSDKPAEGNVKCGTDGTYFQEVYAGGSCGLFDLCNSDDIHLTQQNLRTNFATISCGPG
jgi:hypothetical protein